MQHDFTILLPIIIALIISLWSKNVVIGLFFGVFLGVLMINDFAFFVSLNSFMNDFLVKQLVDSYNAGVLVLLIFIGGFVALMRQSGGAVAFAEKSTKWVNNKFKGQIAAWLGGIIIFFSDLGTPLIVGPVFQPIFDRLKISRQKLALILDSTSSPVAILIPFIGWGVYIMSLIKPELDAINSHVSDWNAFMNALPFQFYAFLAVAIIPVTAYLKVNLGSMNQAEIDMHQPDQIEKLKPFTHENAKASFVWMPLLVVAIVLGVMLVPLGFPFHKVSGSLFRGALSSAYFLGALTLIGLMVLYKVRGLMESVNLYLNGMSGIVSVAIMLILAWTLSSIGKQMGVPELIAELASKGFPSWLLPATTFVIAGIISFSTGSSWGTFAIMMPLVIPTAHAIDASMYACIGAVLSGGLFGDHSSPISETTILSSTGAGCSTIDHFRTQIPYALFNGTISFICFIIAGVFESSFIFLGAIVIQIVLIYALSHKEKLIVKKV